MIVIFLGLTALFLGMFVQSLAALAKGGMYPPKLSLHRRIRLYGIGGGVCLLILFLVWKF